MAVIWQKWVQGTHYEVRTAGSTRRLYSNGVCHSQYSPRRPFQGNVWDLLAIPAVLVPPETIQRVLVLGVGGGAVIKQLERLVQPETIVGVDIDKVHLYVARRLFGVRGSRVHLHRADAVSWLHAYRGKPFDMVVDDLFGEHEGQPIRAIPPTAAWFRALQKHMTPKGLLVVNFESARHFRKAECFGSRQLMKRFEYVYRMSTPQNHNVVAAFVPAGANADRETVNRALSRPPLSSGRLMWRITRGVVRMPSRF